MIEAKKRFVGKSFDRRIKTLENLSRKQTQEWILEDLRKLHEELTESESIRTLSTIPKTFIDEQLKDFDKYVPKELIDEQPETKPYQTPLLLPLTLNPETSGSRPQTTSYERGNMPPRRYNVYQGEQLNINYRSKGSRQPLDFRSHSRRKSAEY